MIEGLLARDEGKTLEFKEGCRPLERIVRTAVAFANTAGGTIVFGVKDKTKEILGVPDPLLHEERLANAFADGIRPLLVPDIRIHAWRKFQLIVVEVSHAVGPFYVQSEGAESGVYVRLGSTNRPAEPELLAELRLPARSRFSTTSPPPKRARKTSTSEQLPSSEGRAFRVSSDPFLPRGDGRSWRKPVTPLSREGPEAVRSLH